MQSKYYTPDIEELFVGMNYQVLVDDYNDIWRDSILPAVSKDINLDVTRIKYLDQADIEEFFPLRICKGNDLFLNTYKFKENNGESSSVLCQKIDKWSCWMITFKDTEVTIGKVNHPDITSIHPVFIGEIKNKSELKKVLNQIGYEQK